MKKRVLAAFLALLGAGMAAQIALAVEDEEMTTDKEQGTSWTCIKRMYTSNPCPEPVDKNA